MSCHNIDSDDETMCQCDRIPVAIFTPCRTNSQNSSDASIGSNQSQDTSAHCDGPARVEDSSHKCGGGGGQDHRRLNSSHRGGCEKCGKFSNDNGNDGENTYEKGGADNNNNKGKTRVNSSSGGRKGRGGSGADKCSSRGSNKSKIPSEHGAERKCGTRGGSASNRRCDRPRSRQRNDCESDLKRSSSRSDKSPSPTCGNRSNEKPPRHAGAGSSEHKSKSDPQRSRATDKSCHAAAVVGHHATKHGPKDEKCELCLKLLRRSERSEMKKPSKCGSKVSKYDGHKNTTGCKDKRKHIDKSSSSGRKEKRQKAQERDDCIQEKARRRCLDKEKMRSCPDKQEARRRCLDKEEEDKNKEKEEEEEGESFTSDDLCLRCQQELCSGGAGVGGSHPLPSTRSSQSSICSTTSTSCANLKPEPGRQSSCSNGAVRQQRSSSVVSGEQRSASCDSVGVHSNSSCDAVGEKSDVSGLIVDVNCPIHGLKANAATRQEETKEDNCGLPACQKKSQVRFSDVTLKRSTGFGPGNKPTTPQDGGTRCSRSKSGQSSCISGKTSRCSSINSHLTSKCNFTDSKCNFADSKLKFDLVFSNIYETLSNEMNRIQTDPCISCCVPKYVTRGKSRSRRNVSVNAGQGNNVEEDGTCECEDVERKRKQPTPCEDKDGNAGCPEDKNGCEKTG